MAKPGSSRVTPPAASRTASPPSREADGFDAARPVWAEGREKEKNVLVEFRARFCRHLAFPFGVATPETQPKLWRALTTDFGPQRKRTKAFPEIFPSTALVGNMPRFELLSRACRTQQILDETIGDWLYMADRTGTLWEHDAPHASCNHGFASHAAHVLGLRQVDMVRRSVRVRVPDVDLDGCEGSVPTPNGPVHLRWWKEGGRVRHRLQVPPGYRTIPENGVQEG